MTDGASLRRHAVEAAWSIFDQAGMVALKPD
eukprot:COSAG05_NODE_10652_length_553_cov_1.837004_2_plen_30_part_01